MTDWTASYFDNLYLKRWPVGLPDDDVRQNAARILRLLGARPGATLLDVGCGQGRYPIAFAEQGLQVTGLDASQVLLDEAVRNASRSKTMITWVRGDMRAMPFHEEFDYTVLMDSFGFFDIPSEDASVLLGMARALKPGGAALLVLVNGQRLIERFVPTGREVRDGFTIEITRTLDGNIMTEHLSFREGERVTSGSRRQRLYSPDELLSAATTVGFQVEGFHGDMKEGTFAAHVSEKMVLKMKKSRT